MTILDAIAEQRIRDAQSRGEFDDLPGAGAPLELDDDALVPDDLRVAHRILRNAGLLPPALAAHGELREVEQLLAAAEDALARTRLHAKARFLMGRGTDGRLRGDLRVEQAYFERIVEHLDHRRPAAGT